MKRLTALFLALILVLSFSMRAIALPDATPTDAPGSETPPDPPGGGTTSDTLVWSGAETITAAATRDSESYSSTKSNENALLINTDAEVVINKPAITKSGDSDDSDNCSFYGINSALLAAGGSKVTVTGGTVETTARGANGVFSYGGNGGRNDASGDGTTLKITDTVINTSGNNAGGIMTVGGGITIAENLTVTTSGQSSAPIRTDRGGGSVTVTGGTFTSGGVGSPAIYCTADITAGGATLVSKLSEGVVIEGKNSVSLKDCYLSANNTQLNGSASFLDTVMLYQSMSGDAASGATSFTMSGGKIESKSGHVFHVTNTSGVITLSSVKIENSDSSGVLLSVCDDGWSGASNKAALNVSFQELSGRILVGSNSVLDLSLSDSSTFSGSIGGEITNAKGNAVSSSVGTVNVKLGQGCKWNLTGDSYITKLDGDLSSVTANGYKLYIDGQEAKLNGGETTSPTESTTTAATESTTTTTAADTTTTTVSGDTTTTTARVVSDKERRNTNALLMVLVVFAFLLTVSVVVIIIIRNRDAKEANEIVNESGQGGGTAQM